MYGEDLEREAAMERQARKADRRMQGVPTDVEQVPSLERRKERQVVGGTEPQLAREVDKPSIRISAEWENLFRMSELAINHMNAQLYILQYK
ncbi:hypothetical protein [Kordiimonas sp.]|uniref:hypothetical protein n=1 Tax=Kordiimonas sp. TaxID=1970157 RepID=UPI003B51C8AF